MRPLIIVSTIWILSSCSITNSLGIGEKEDKQAAEDNSNTIEADDAAIAGSKIEFNASDFPEGTNFDIQQGSLVINNDNMSELGLPTDSQAASASLNISSDQNISAVDAGKLEITLPLSNTQLALVQENTQLVVVYHVKDSDGRLLLGVIFGENLNLDNNELRFFGKGLGNYQAVYIPQEIAPPAEPVETQNEFTTAAEEQQNTNTDTDTSTDTTSVTNALPGSITVSAKYPANGVNWGDYVDSPGNDISCNYDTPDFDEDCIHGAEWKRAFVTGVVNCDGLNATDDLNLFHWHCMTVNGTATFYGELKNDKGLNDLLDYSGASPVWKNNKLNITKDAESVSSAPAKWWNNIIESVPADGDLDTSGTVYYLDSSQTRAELNLTVDKVALVIKSGAEITSDSPTLNCGGFDSLVCIEGNYSWVEGAFSGAAHDYVIHANNRRFSTIRNVSAEVGAVSTVFLENSKFSRVQNVTIQNNAVTAGLELNTCEGLVVENISLVDNAGDGVYIDTVDDSEFRHISIENSGFYGFYMSASTGNEVRHVETYLSEGASESGFHIAFGTDDNYFEDIRSSSNAGVGVYNDGDNNILVNVSSFNNEQNAIVLRGVNPVLINAVAAGSPSTYALVNTMSTANGALMTNVSAFFTDHAGIEILGPNVTANNVLVANSSQESIEVTNSSGVTNLLNVGALYATVSILNSTTASDSAVWQGLWNLFGTTTCTEFSDHPDISGGVCIDTMNSSLDITLADPSSSIVGKIAAGDETFDGITNWVYPNMYKVIGAQSSTDWTSTEAREICTTSETCSKYDLALKKSDTVLRNILSCPNGNVTFDHTFSGESSITAIQNAVEIMSGPHANGNRNGLCESSENCMITVNRGAYQGHGDLIPAAEAQPDTVVCSEATANTNGFSNVKLFKYRFNGY